MTRGPKLHGQSVRTARWRFTRWSDGAQELYDHSNDPEENSDASQANPGVAATLTAMLKTLPPYPPTP